VRTSRGTRLVIVRVRRVRKNAFTFYRGAGRHVPLTPLPFPKRPSERSSVCQDHRLSGVGGPARLRAPFCMRPSSRSSSPGPWTRRTSQRVSTLGRALESFFRVSPFFHRRRTPPALSTVAFAFQALKIFSLFRILFVYDSRRLKCPF